MNKLIKTILLILLGNVMVAQNLQISLEKAMDIKGTEFNANESIEKFKNEDKGPIVRYFQMQGIKEIGVDQNIPILEEKKAPKNFLDASIVETRFSKNKLFGDHDTSNKLIDKYIGGDRSEPLLFMFMFKECVHCKTDLPHLKRLMETDFANYSINVLTFSTQADIEAIMRDSNIECDVLTLPKSDIREEFDIPAYPRYLLFDQDGVLTTELSSLKNIGLTASIKNN